MVIQQRVLPEYQVPSPLLCRYYCRGDADLYRVTTETGEFYLKLYRAPHWLERVEAEAKCMIALANAGLPVIRPVPRHDGNFATEVRASEGLRPALLVEMAPPPFPSSIDPDLAGLLGQAVAKLHCTADSQKAELGLPRRDGPIDPERQLRHARQYLTAVDYEFLRNVGKETYPLLESLLAESADYGLCHRDLVRSNLRMTADGVITFFDFGNAGYDFRAYDLSVCYQTTHAKSQETAEECWSAFQAGYSAVRTLPEKLDRLLPLLRLYRQMDALGLAAAQGPLRMGEEMILGYLPGAMSKIGESYQAIVENTSGGN